MQRHPTPTQLFAAALGAAVVALLPLWETWVVLSRGDMSAIHCNGLFAGTLCAGGTNLGTWLFGHNQGHLGYASLSGSLAIVLLLASWHSYARGTKLARQLDHT